MGAFEDVGADAKHTVDGVEGPVDSASKGDIEGVPTVPEVPDPLPDPLPDPASAPAPGPVGQETVLSRSYRALTLGIVSVVLLIAFEATAVGTAMPVAAQELNGISVYAFAFSAYFTTSLLGMVVSGQWNDRSGPLAPLGTGIAAFAAGLLLSGTATAMWVFVLGRAAQGIGGGLVIVALYVTVSRAYPERLRPTVMASFAAAWVVPSVVGPLISGTVTQQLGWRWVFLGIPVLVLLPLAVMLPTLRRATGSTATASTATGAVGGSPRARGRIRLAFAVAAGAGLIQYGAQKLTILSLGPVVIGAVLLVPAVLRLLPPGTYRAARGLPAVVLLRGMAAGAYVVAESFIPLMLVTQRGLSVTMAGLTLAAGGATWALGSFTQSRPRLTPHRERLTRFGMVLVTASIAYTPAVLADGVPVWTLAVAMAVGCYGMGLVISSTSVLLLQLSAPEETGKNSSSLQMSDSLSNVLLLAATGAAFAAFGGGAVSTAHSATASASPSASEAAAHAASGGGAQPAAFVAVYILSAAVAALGIVVAGRLRK
ncbi:MFS transporter [Streptomyces daliensis]|uniref:MFS transporter n=1 Tax=Streptomyces daliensis TaxID=299421 RepID=A0A8T4INM9_9ACTN|nr:MFS transporter [Streptomyces daliensis]